MDSAAALHELIEESQRLSPEKDCARLLEIFTQAATLVDRSAQPRKWAALRMRYGQLAFPEKLENALEAFHDALPVWTDPADRATLLECKSYIGWTLFMLGRVTPPQSEEAIECLESTLADYPAGTPQMLALLYEVRPLGDPLDNWNKQVHYLALALAQIDVQQDPVQWALAKNKIAVALTLEPGGQFEKAVDTRIAFHHEALAVVAPLKAANLAALDAWIRISLDSSAAYLCRVFGTLAENLHTAAAFAKAAYEACTPALSRDTQSLAAMAWARALLNEDTAVSPDHCHEALKVCAAVDALLDNKAEAAATNEKFKALAYLNLVRSGQLDQLDNLLTHVEQADAMLPPPFHLQERRTLMQLAVDGLFHAGDFPRATPFLVKATDACEQALEQATSRAGRLERIFDLHDSYALLAYCHLRAGDIMEGLLALERGKGRLWSQQTPALAMAQLRSLVPAGGALLFPVFAPHDGLLAVITHDTERVCPLPHLGGERLKAMLVGDIQNPDADSWMGRYCRRHDRKAAWLDKLASTGGLLHELLWLPAIEVLRDLGIADGAELVWFPQGGLGVLPLHAAWHQDAEGRHWIGEKYAVRYAPAARWLIGKESHLAEAAPALLVADTVSLPYTALEVAWAQQSLSADTVTLLSGADASRTRVLEALVPATLVHFATHGVFDTADPFQSGLILAASDRLTLDQLLPVIEKSALRQVVLTGCETAMAPSWRRADESLGFPAAFLAHGVSTVVATQWPVDDWASAALVGRFFKEWHQSAARSTAQALRSAQNWLRAVTVSELRDWVEPMAEDSGPAGGLALELQLWLSGKEDAEKPFSHPFFWAGFTASGL